MVGDEGVIVLQERGEIVVVNELGARIVDLLSKQTIARREDIVSVLERTYDVERPTLEDDVRVFLEDLVNGGIAEICAVQPSAAGESDDTI